jgi:orotidine-5'-phosphate decarboxylase
MQAVGSCLCLGVDPDPQALPRGMTADVRGVERFARMVLEAALPYAAAVKLNLAFFEAWGSSGVAALERLRAAVPADIPFIADAKRGDIPSTAARQAAALFDALGADAATANPYLGPDALLPLLERADRFVYVVCRTSNAGASEIQDMIVEGEPLHIQVARRAAAWAAEHPRLGLVAGATAPRQLAAIRAAAPGLAMLVPGLGAQGGALPPVLEHGPAQTPPLSQLPAGGLLVNVSRSIAAAALDTDEPEEQVAAAARDWSGRLGIPQGQVLG